MPAPDQPLFDAWLHDFYKECGREVTLAYTTLNQMKNWAIVVQGTIIAAVAAFGRSALSSGATTANRDIGVAVVVGAVLSHLFTLRFMVRSIICYVNLLRWNTLQKAIIEFEFKVSKNIAVTQALTDTGLESKIQHYYFEWASTIPRGRQVSSVLKLGFGLLLALPTALIVWGAFAHWNVALVQGLTVFAIGGTIIELIDFVLYRDFDTPERAARRKTPRPTFPAPSGTARYIIGWMLNLVISSWIVLGIAGLKSLPVYPAIPVILIGCSLYLVLYILGTGFIPRPEKLLVHLCQLLAAFVGIVALAALASFSRIFVLGAAGAGLLLACIALARRDGKRAAANPQKTDAAPASGDKRAGGKTEGEITKA